MPNRQGWTPVCIAAQYGHATAITALHNAGAHVDMPNKKGWTPVCIAAEHGHAAVITALHAAGAYVDMPNKEGWTAVCIAAAAGHAAVITALKAAGANMNEQMRDGRTPVHIAAEHGLAFVMTALLKAGADACIRTKMGTALELARQGTTPGHLETVKILEEHLDLANALQHSEVAPTVIHAFHLSTEGKTPPPSTVAGSVLSTPKSKG
jgi:ankyrin repeat protein